MSISGNFGSRNIRGFSTVAKIAKKLHVRIILGHPIRDTYPKTTNSRAVMQPISPWSHPHGDRHTYSTRVRSQGSGTDRHRYRGRATRAAVGWPARSSSSESFWSRSRTFSTLVRIISTTWETRRGRSRHGSHTGQETHRQRRRHAKRRVQSGLVSRLVHSGPARPPAVAWRYDPGVG